MDSDEKICPFCAETIKSAAIKCKHCGSDLNSSSSPPPPTPVHMANKDPIPVERKMKSFRLSKEPIGACSGLVIIFIGVLVLLPFVRGCIGGE